MRKVDVRYTLLLDYYGGLLPQKQYELANLYYNDDLSLSEIAQELSITRQGALDGLSRAENALVSFDEALGLIEKDKAVRSAVEEILCEAEKLGKDSADRIRKACEIIVPKG